MSAGSGASGGSTGGGALEELTYEQILEYLHSIERERASGSHGLNLLSKRKDLVQSGQLFPYRERFLEHILKRD